MYQYNKTHKRLLLQPNLGLMEVHVRMTKKKENPTLRFRAPHTLNTASLCNSTACVSLRRAVELHGCVMYTHVHGEVTLVRKRARTNGTAERLLACVTPHVNHQVALVVKGSRADSAAVRLLSCVGAHVDNQALLVLETPRADVARVGLLPCMLIDMLH